MKGLVIGGGSIGARHLRNLLKHDNIVCALVELDAPRRMALEQELEIPGFGQLAEGLNWGPDFVIVASPTHLHTAHALAAARQGCHLFVEKPLSHEPAGLAELHAEVERRQLITLVGCNMRFHPGPAQVKQLLEQGAIGKVLFARVQVGWYLPRWRPHQDYRTSYSANAAMGGGCLLDCIHEIDLTRWYVGDVAHVFCAAQRTGTLEVDVEDTAALLCRHADGVISEIHLDFVQRTYERGCQIVGERGSVFWDFRQGEVRWFDARGEQWQVFPQPAAWDVNDMYVEELSHFLECVRGRTPTVLPVAQALGLMEIVFAAKRSIESERMERVNGQSG